MKQTTFLLSLILLSPLLLPPFLAAQEGPEGNPPPPPPPKHHPAPHPEKPFKPGHPLLRVLDSDEFSQEERTRLRKLSIENPPEFAREMRKLFRQRRQEKAKAMLALRQSYLDAKTPELKEAARKKIQETIRKDTERHLLFQKKILTDTERSLRQMEKRLADMKQRYEKQQASKNALIERRTRELLASDPPPHLLREAAGDFRKPQKKRK